MTEVTMPRLSDSMEEGTVLKRLVEEGGEVERGEPLVEIETDKANMTYEADTDGTLIEVVAQEGDTLAIGEVIARIGDPSEAGGNGKPAKAEKQEAAGGGETQAGAGTATKERTPSGNGRRVNAFRNAASPTTERSCTPSKSTRGSSPTGGLRESYSPSCAGPTTRTSKSRANAGPGAPSRLRSATSHCLDTSSCEAFGAGSLPRSPPTPR